ncbi:MAG: chalcone isomerase family protein [Desulfovibrionaceae bacterium]
MNQHRPSRNARARLRRIAALAACLCCLAALPMNASAAELDGITLPDTLEADGTTLALNGMAQRSVVWIDVYVAGLHLPAPTADAAQALAMDGPKRMTMVFQRDVDRGDICKAWKEGFEQNAPGGGSMLMEELETLCAATPEETKEGQTVTYTWMPSEDATIFAVDGAELGRYPGREFFSALLSCWIGPEPGPGRGFKRGVLGEE